MAIRPLLTQLAEASGVSGHEEPVRRLVIRELKKYADEVTLSKLGSVIALKRATTFSGKRRRGVVGPKLLIEAHLDEIGLMVTALDQGFIRFTTIGGYDVRVLPAQNVIVHGRSRLPGVIGTRPPHVLSNEERGKAIARNALFIDVGLSAERLGEMVAVGDVITLDRPVTALCNDFVTGKALDNRAGVGTVIETLRLLKEAALHWDVYAVANVQEEAGAGYAGAVTSTFQIKPEVAVAVDVTHGDQPGAGEVNVTPLGSGPGIARGANIHPRVHARLLEVAQAQQIEHRVTVYAASTDTDAWAMQIVGEGIPTGLIELPLRYMHSPVETVALRDLDRAAKLLAGFALSLDDTFYRELEASTRVQLTRRTLKPKPSAKRKRSQK